MATFSAVNKNIKKNTPFKTMSRNTEAIGIALLPPCSLGSGNGQTHTQTDQVPQPLLRTRANWM